MKWNSEWKKDSWFQKFPTIGRSHSSIRLTLEELHKVANWSGPTLSKSPKWYRLKRWIKSSQGNSKELLNKEVLSQLRLVANSSLFAGSEVLIAVWQDDSHFYFATPFWDGVTLADRLNQLEMGSKIQTWQDVLDTWDRWLVALKRLQQWHDAGLYHGNLKPQNVLMSYSQGSGWSVSLLDGGGRALLPLSEITQRLRGVNRQLQYAWEEDYRQVWWPPETWDPTFHPYCEQSEIFSMISMLLLDLGWITSSPIPFSKIEERYQTKVSSAKMGEQRLSIYSKLWPVFWNREISSAIDSGGGSQPGMSFEFIDNRFLLFPEDKPVQESWARFRSLVHRTLFKRDTPLSNVISELTLCLTQGRSHQNSSSSLLKPVSNDVALEWIKGPHVISQSRSILQNHVTQRSESLGSWLAQRGRHPGSSASSEWILDFSHEEEEKSLVNALILDGIEVMSYRFTGYPFLNVPYLSLESFIQQVLLKIHQKGMGIALAWQNILGPYKVAMSGLLFHFPILKRILGQTLQAQEDKDLWLGEHVLPQKQEWFEMSLLQILKRLMELTQCQIYVLEGLDQMDKSSSQLIRNAIRSLDGVGLLEVRQTHCSQEFKANRFANHWEPQDRKWLWGLAQRYPSGVVALEEIQNYHSIVKEEHANIELSDYLFKLRENEVIWYYITSEKSLFNPFHFASSEVYEWCRLGLSRTDLAHHAWFMIEKGMDDFIIDQKSFAELRQTLELLFLCPFEKTVHAIYVILLVMFEELCNQASATFLLQIFKKFEDRLLLCALPEKGLLLLRVREALALLMRHAGSNEKAMIYFESIKKEVTSQKRMVILNMQAFDPDLYWQRIWDLEFSSISQLENLSLGDREFQDIIDLGLECGLLSSMTFSNPGWDENSLASFVLSKLEELCGPSPMKTAETIVSRKLSDFINIKIRSSHLKLEMLPYHPRKGTIKEQIFSTFLRKSLGMVDPKKIALNCIRALEMAFWSGHISICLDLVFTFLLACDRTLKSDSRSLILDCMGTLSQTHKLEQHRVDIVLLRCWYSAIFEGDLLSARKGVSGLQIQKETLTKSQRQLMSQLSCLLDWENDSEIHLRSGLPSELTAREKSLTNWYAGHLLWGKFPPNAPQGPEWTGLVSSILTEKLDQVLIYSYFCVSEGHPQPIARIQELLHTHRLRNWLSYGAKTLLYLPNFIVKDWQSQMNLDAIEDSESALRKLKIKEIVKGESKSTPLFKRPSGNLNPILKLMSKDPNVSPKTPQVTPKSTSRWQQDEELKRQLQLQSLMKHPEWQRSRDSAMALGFQWETIPHMEVDQIKVFIAICKRNKFYFLAHRLTQKHRIPVNESGSKTAPKEEFTEMNHPLFAKWLTWIAKEAVPLSSQTGEPNDRQREAWWQSFKLQNPS